MILRFPVIPLPSVPLKLALYKSVYYYYFFLPGENPGVSKITKENYETCLEVHPTLAGRHQRNHHAAKPN